MHPLLDRRAATSETSSPGTDRASGPTTDVISFAREHAAMVERSDKEVPKRFQDLRPVEGTIDPGYFFVPEPMCGSRLGESAANIGSYRTFLRRHKDTPGVFPLTGSHGSFGVAIRISSITPEMVEQFEALLGKAPKSDVETVKAEHVEIDEAWNAWAHFDFIEALTSSHPDEAEWIDSFDDDQVRELFDTVRRRLNLDWSGEGDALTIDVDQIAAAVTPAEMRD